MNSGDFHFAQSAEDFQRNNFDLLRLCLAASVFLVHSGVLSGSETLKNAFSFLNSQRAVECFFVVSGFLVTASFERSRALRSYFVKRAARIYPAYLLVIVVSMVLGAFLSSLPLTGYVSAGLLRYAAANIVFLNFLQPDLPGVFQGQQFSAVNGALWTIKIEVAFYLSVPAIACLARWSRRPLLICAVLYAAAFVYRGLVSSAATPELLARQYPGQLCFFAAGAALFYGFGFARKYTAALGLAGMLGYGMLPQFLLPVLQPMLLAGIVFWLAYGIPRFTKLQRFGDISYGVYVYHCPVLQALISFGTFAAHPWLGFGSAAVLVVLAAILSWRFVESPCLALTKRRVDSHAQGSSGQNAPRVRAGAA